MTVNCTRTECKCPKWSALEILGFLGLSIWTPLFRPSWLLGKLALTVRFLWWLTIFVLKPQTGQLTPTLEQFEPIATIHTGQHWCAHLSQCNAVWFLWEFLLPEFFSGSFRIQPQHVWIVTLLLYQPSSTDLRFLGPFSLCGHHAIPHSLCHSLQIVD